MPFIASLDGERVFPEQIDNEDAELECIDCGAVVRIRQSHQRENSFVARHFWHPNGTPDGCEGVGGESWKHERMKSIAASKAKKRWEDATVQLEQQVGEHWADVLVEFEEFHPRYGNGIAIEAQYKHTDKDFEAAEEDYLENRYSVLWLREAQYTGKDVALDDGEWLIWWATAVPDSNQWSGYHGIVHWLKQEQRPPVELEVSFPLTWFGETLRKAWKRGKKSNEKWSSDHRSRLGIGTSFLSLSRAPKSNDPFLVLSKGKRSQNEIVHLPLKLNKKNANKLQYFAEGIEDLPGEDGQYVDENADDWETEVEVWLDTSGTRYKGLLKIIRPPDGTIALQLRKIKGSSFEDVTVAGRNIHPGKAITAVREIASAIEEDA